MSECWYMVGKAITSPLGIEGNEDASRTSKPIHGS